MSQVARPGGLISLVVWGPPEQCESGVMSPNWPAAAA